MDARFRQCNLNAAGRTGEAYIRATLETAPHGSAEYVMEPLTILGAPCEADFNGDGALNTQDALAFLNAWTEGCF